ncbi:hypothetical protein FPV67DRAFT_1487756 [Lyophyllum atratum]|nr:hypothetical protein FPV67DRAFT_1487756 [Lyophyllum atratum]
MDTLASSESTAGNFHLSTTNSSQRLRATATNLYLAKDDTHASVSQPHDQSLLDMASFLRYALFPGPGPPASNRHLYARSWSKLCLTWMLLTYCLLSFVVFSVDLYIHTSRGGVEELNKLHTSSAPNFLDFDPFIIRSDEILDTASVTACLWTTELQDFDILRSWALQWDGKSLRGGSAGNDRFHS